MVLVVEPAAGWKRAACCRLRGAEWQLVRQRKHTPDASDAGTPRPHAGVIGRPQPPALATSRPCPCALTSCRGWRDYCHAVKMRAAVLTGVNAALRVADVDLAPPQAGEVLVKVAASGLCGSDLNAITGKRTLVPFP